MELTKHEKELFEKFSEEQKNKILELNKKIESMKEEFKEHEGKIIK
jgi:hypothetical protein